MNVRERAIKLLAQREHSQLELKRKLAAKGFSHSEIESVLASLIEEGYQSDERFAEVYVRRRAELGFGPRRITLELRERGIAESLIGLYVSNDLEYWLSQMQKVCEKKYRTINDRDFSSKVRFLLQRGFETEWIYRWLRDVSCKSP